MSRPGKLSSKCFVNSVSIDIKSSKCPCLAQSLTIQILPSRSTIWALISPTFSIWKTLFQVLREFRVNRHQVFEVPVLGAVLDHPDLAVAFDDLGFNLSHFFDLENSLPSAS